MLVSFLVDADLRLNELVVLVNEVDFPDGLEHFAGDDVHVREVDGLEIPVDEGGEVFDQLAFFLEFD